MNKLNAKQLIMLNQKIVGEEARLNESRMAQIKNIAEIPYEKDDEFFFVYRTTVEKAAKLGCLIATKKPFLRGNEQTAMLAMFTFLEINGSNVYESRESLNDLSVCLNNDDLSGTCRWLKAHIVTREKIRTDLIP